MKKLLVEKMEYFKVHRFKLTMYGVRLIPLIIWYVLFTSTKRLPHEYRANIDTSSLPRTEFFIFRSFPHRWFQPNIVLDLLAMIPYCVHPLLPFGISFQLYQKYNISRVLLFLWCFGLLNSLAVILHLSFPTAPPWYFERFGLESADYSLPGDPGRLGEVDRYFGMTIWTTVYYNNPVVFGAMPSLHAAWPCLVALFYEGRYPKWVWAYVVWVWWAAIYLQHHYFLDVIAGAACSVVFYVICCQQHLVTNALAFFGLATPVKEGMVNNGSSLNLLLLGDEQSMNGKGDLEKGYSYDPEKAAK